MILDLPYNYWIEGDFPFRQRPVLRVTETHPFEIAEISAAELHPLRTLQLGATTYSWYLGPDDFTYRLLLNQDGSTASVEDLCNAKGEVLYGHFQRRSWWRDHPSSIDLAPEVDLRLAYAPPVGASGTPFDIAKGKRLIERPHTRLNFVRQVEIQANLLRIAPVGILIQSPLPGFVVQKAAGKVAIDPWVPVADEGFAPIRLHFYGDCLDQARRCAALLEDCDPLDDDKPFFGDPDLEFALNAQRSSGQTSAPPDASLSSNPSVDEAFYWQPLRSTLIGVLSEVAAQKRFTNIPKNELSGHGGLSTLARDLDGEYCAKRLREFAPTIGIPDEATELAIWCASSAFSGSPW